MYFVDYGNGIDIELSAKNVREAMKVIEKNHVERIATLYVKKRNKIYSIGYYDGVDWYTVLSRSDENVC